MSTTPLTLYVNCSKCGGLRKVAVDDPSALVTPADAQEGTTIACPGCHDSIKLSRTTIGCVSCRQAFRVADVLLGSSGACPNCRQPVSFPTAAQLKRLNKKVGRCRWIVFPALQEAPVRLSGRAELVALMKERKLAPNHECMVHEFAPPAALMQACNRVFAIRKLYDPKGAYQDVLDGITAVLAFGSGVISITVLIHLTGDPLFWPGGTPERVIMKLVAAGLVILVGFAIGALPVGWALHKLSSLGLERMSFKPPKIDWLTSQEREEAQGPTGVTPASLKAQKAYAAMSQEEFAGLRRDWLLPEAQEAYDREVEHRKLSEGTRAKESPPNEGAAGDGQNPAAPERQSR